MGLLDSIKNSFAEAKRKNNERLVAIQEAKEERKKHLLEMYNGNNLPNEPTSGILLQKGEICHTSYPAVRYETKTVTKGYAGGYSGVSIKVAKGVTFHTGGTRGHAVKEQVGVKYPGKIYITNKRVIFVADKKNFTITYGKLISVTPYRDGFGFNKENGSYIILLNNVEYMGAVLNGAINNFLNK